MNITDYTHTVFSLFGKSRAFDVEQIKTLLSQQGNTLIQGYDPQATVIVEGAMMPTPLKIKAEELYEKKEVTFIAIDTFEAQLAKNINPKTLLMHLKLAAHQEKIVSYLQNDYIEDTLFLELLKLYDFGGEDFFESDTNRNVTAALIRRFYKEYTTNHNIQYSNIGLVHVVQNNTDAKLLERIFLLSPVQKALLDPTSPNAKLIQIFALHPNTPQNVLEQIVQNGEITYMRSVAKRENLSVALQEKLLTFQDATIEQILSSKASLAPNVAQQLLEKGYQEMLAQHITLNEELFKKLKHIPQIAQNPSLTSAMQQELFCDPKYHIFLAKNPKTTLQKELFALQNSEITQALYAHVNLQNITPQIQGNEVALASNPTATQELLEQIFATNIDKAHKALATNPATPVAILYQLSFDMRYAHLVKQNPSYTTHIKTTHAIGIFA
jgi:hypothetical protein